MQTAKPYGERGNEREQDAPVTLPAARRPNGAHCRPALSVRWLFSFSRVQCAHWDDISFARFARSSRQPVVRPGSRRPGDAARVHRVCVVGARSWRHAWRRAVVIIGARVHGSVSAAVQLAGASPGVAGRVGVSSLPAGRGQRALNRRGARYPSAMGRAADVPQLAANRAVRIRRVLPAGSVIRWMTFGMAKLRLVLALPRYAAVVRVPEKVQVFRRNSPRGFEARGISPLPWEARHRPGRVRVRPGRRQGLR